MKEKMEVPAVGSECNRNDTHDEGEDICNDRILDPVSVPFPFMVERTRI